MFLQEFLVNTLRSLLEQLYSVRKTVAVNQPVAVAASEGSTVSENIVALPVGNMEEKEAPLEDRGNRPEDEDDDGRVEPRQVSSVMDICPKQVEHCSLSQPDCELNKLEADITSEILEDMENERFFSEEERNEADIAEEEKPMEFREEKNEENIVSCEDEERPVEVEEVNSDVEVRTQECYQATLSQWSRGESHGSISKQVELFFYWLVCIHANNTTCHCNPVHIYLQPVKMCPPRAKSKSPQLKSKLLFVRLQLRLSHPFTNN